nr:MAG TPA: hypothetical protein [Caudoviricetes sp.]
MVLSLQWSIERKQATKHTPRTTTKHAYIHRYIIAENYFT